MQFATNRLALATAVSLALTALPIAHGEGDEMTVKMNGNFITADPENIKWAANKSAPYGMQTIVLYGDVPHFAWARTEVIIQEMGEGGHEGTIEFVNPDDDPRTQ